MANHGLPGDTPSELAYGSLQFWGASVGRAGARVPVGSSWVDPASNEMPDDVFLALAKHAVVLLGETHDEVEHHRWQLHTIAARSRSGGKGPKDLNLADAHSE